MSRLALLPLLALLAGAAPQPVADFGPNLERFAYPFAVERLVVDVSGAPAEMAFMDVRPARPNGQAVVLLHGKNFCGATWESTARALSGAGYRVLIPDQIGFCKSAKPREAQYSFAMLAANTARLIEAQGIAKAHIVGHSMGGMLAMRFAILFPGRVERLVLVNPLGLVDRQAEGVPYAGVGELLAEERKVSFESIKRYQRANYYHGEWRPEYDRWVAMLAGMSVGVGREDVALAAAKTGEMILAQPVAHELGRIGAPTTLLIGTLDGTAFGKARVPEPKRAGIRPIPAVAPDAARRIPDARLVRLEGLGHSPQVEAPARFEAALMDALRAPKPPSG